ncbi:hypothetical protein V1478_015379 [Vespula squamosa]|uniref:Uncharacterized protein n=1 Tax=Vespula squamosa TaxID=30214 RepID=A0ABD2A4X5_VESSQ
MKQSTYSNFVLVSLILSSWKSSMYNVTWQMQPKCYIFEDYINSKTVANLKKKKKNDNIYVTFNDSKSFFFQDLFTL